MIPEATHIFSKQVMSSYVLHFLLLDCKNEIYAHEQTGRQIERMGIGGVLIFVSHGHVSGFYLPSGHKVSSS